jgi:hypothetical protein
MDYTPNQLCGVQCRDDPNNDFWNTVTVKVRSVKNDADISIGTSITSPRDNDGNTGTPDKIMHHYCLVLQRYSQKYGGNPYMPRIGDMVAVLFILNQKPLVLGTVNTDQQDPVCRSPFSPHNPNAIDARYDEVNKWSQWVRPIFNKNEEVVVHYPGRHPNCTKTFHKNRDQMKVTDCKQGCKSSCKCCKNMDHVKRCGNQWEKIYSCETCAKDPEHPYIPACNEKAKRRHEWHEPCGSYFVFQNNCGDQDYGKGLVRLENATCENQMKGHLNLDPKGTIDIHSKHCNAPYATEAEGTRVSVVALEDNSVTHSVEAIDFSKGSWIRIFKSGDIGIHSLENSSYIDIDGTFEKIIIYGANIIEQHAASRIDMITPLVHITGNLVVDGSLTHGGGACCQSPYELNGWF